MGHLFLWMRFNFQTARRKGASAMGWIWTYGSHKFCAILHDVGRGVRNQPSPVGDKRVTLVKARFGRLALPGPLPDREQKRLFKKDFPADTSRRRQGAFLLRSLPGIETVLPTYNKIGMPKTTRKRDHKL